MRTLLRVLGDTDDLPESVLDLIERYVPDERRVIERRRRRFEDERRLRRAASELRRAEFLAELEALDVAGRLVAMARQSEFGASYFPDEWAATADEAVRTLGAEDRLRVDAMLARASKGAWRDLGRRLRKAVSS